MNIRIALLFIIFNISFAYGLQAQSHLCDTVYMQRLNFIYAETKISMYKFKKSGCNFIEKRFIRNDSSSIYFSNCIGKSYFIFLDKNKRKIEEGYWMGEFFDGEYISYYNNGKIKSKGKYDGIDKLGKWIYYDKNGKLIKTENY